MSSGNYAKHAFIWDLYAHDRSSEVACWQRLAQKYGQFALAAMAATGTIAAGLAERGLEVTAVDITPEMVAEGKQKHGTMPNLHFVEGDICALQLEMGPYDFAFVGTTSFHHLQTAELRMAALNSLGRNLRPGGALALELWYPGSQSWASPERVFEPPQALDPSIKVWKKGRTEYYADRRLVTIAQEVFIERDGKLEQFPHAFDLQLFERETLVAELSKAGFDLVAEYGSYDLDAWTPESGKWIVEAVRKG